jgi:hypothetical protein
VRLLAQTLDLRSAYHPDESPNRVMVLRALDDLERVVLEEARACFAVYGAACLEQVQVVVLSGTAVDDVIALESAPVE